MRREETSPLGLYVGCIGFFAMMLAFAPKIVTSTFGLLLIGLALLGAIAFVIVGVVVEHRNIGRLLSILAISGVFTFVFIYGVIWFFVYYFASHPLFGPLGGGS